MEPRDVSHRCFHHLFEAQAERSPEALAVSCKADHLTYRELNQKANQLARHLRALGTAPEPVVGICMERAPEMMVALLGILKAGAAYLRLDAFTPIERVYMLQDVRAPILLTQEKEFRATLLSK